MYILFFRENGRMGDPSAYQNHWNSALKNMRFATHECAKISTHVNSTSPAHLSEAKDEGNPAMCIEMFCKTWMIDLSIS